MKTIFILIFLITSAAFCYGQDTTEDRSMEKKQAMLDKLTTELSLTVKQQRQVMKMLSGRAKKFKELKESGKKENEKRNQIQNIKQSTRKDLSGILTKEQYELFITLANELEQSRQRAYKDHPRKKNDSELDL